MPPSAYDEAAINVRKKKFRLANYNVDIIQCIEVSVNVAKAENVHSTVYVCGRIMASPNIAVHN